MTQDNSRPVADSPSLHWLERFDDIHLDALGMLDDDDRVALDAWWASLPPAAQEHFRNEQRRLALTAPMVATEPGADLRVKVLQAVLAAATERERQGEPATQGIGRSDLRRHAPGRPAAAAMRGRRVHPMWRAATFGLAVCVIGVVAFHVQSQTFMEGIRQQASLASLIEAAGGEHVQTVLFSDSVRPVMFSAEPGVSGLKASLWFRNDDRVAYLYVGGRPPQSGEVRYRLAVVDADGNVAKESIESFAANGVIQQVQFSAHRLDGVRRVALIAVRDGVDTVLMTADLA